MKSARIIFQGKSKPNPNLAKLSQIQPSRAKSNQGKSLDFLGRIEPYQRLARTPCGVFSFSSSIPARFVPIPPKRPMAGAPVSRKILRRPSSRQFVPGIVSSITPASFAAVRSASRPPKSSMAQFRRICKEKSKKPRNGPEFLAIGDAIADRVCRGQRPRLQTAATERLTLFRAPISRAPARRPAIRSARPAGCPRPSV